MYKSTPVLSLLKFSIFRINKIVSVILIPNFSILYYSIHQNLGNMSVENAPLQGITLYSHADDFRSHWIRYVLAEKQIKYNLIMELGGLCYV